MARETFISYKYSEAQEVRDRICKALGADARFYKGETSDSPNLTDYKTDTIKNNLKDMIHGTSVTIVVVSPNMVKSKWIDWEIEYSLKEIKRGDAYSKTNGVVGVVMEISGKYDWFISHQSHPCGCTNRHYDPRYLYKVITENRFNRKSDTKNDVILCKQCGAINSSTGSYISLIKENDFVLNPSVYIEEAYEKSRNLHLFNITKQSQ